MSREHAARPHSLSMFFPAYNDGGTIASLVIRAVQVASRLTPDFEVIVVNDGSSDATADICDELVANVPAGARRSITPAIADTVARCAPDSRRQRRSSSPTPTATRSTTRRSSTCSGASLTPDADMVTGYKISRSDPWHRIVIGRMYHHTVKLMFRLRVRDVDCDFRLMRREIFDRVRLERDTGVICLEMMRKIQDAGFRVVEVPVHHYHRTHGRSQFFNFHRIFWTGIDVLKLWVQLVVFGPRTPEHAGAVPQSDHQRRGSRPSPPSVNEYRELLPRTPRDDHRRPRVHRQQPRASARRARRAGCCSSIR